MGKKPAKKSKVGIDFKKAKVKIGKKLPKAQNDTDVSFKARSIALPSQGIAVGKDAAAVTSRNLTLKEVLGQCSHYSERVRKDALLGLLELLTGHPGACRRHTATIVDRLCERFTDAAAPVRAALRDCVAKGLLPAYDPPALAPFVPLLTAHLQAALTHVSEGVRLDGLAILEALAQQLPRQLLGSWLAGAVSAYAGLLQYGAQGSGVQMRPLKSVYKVVSRLQRFLSIVVAAQREEAAAAEAAQAAAAASGHALGAARTAPLPAAAAGQLRSTLALLGRLSGGCGGGPHALAVHVGVRSELFLVGAPITGKAASTKPGGPAASPAAKPGGSQGGKGAGAAAAARGANGGTPGADGDDAAVLRGSLQQLDARLASVWTECCPGQLAADPELLPVQCMASTLQAASCVLTLLRGAGDGGAEAADAALGEWRRRVAPHLPAQLHEGAPPQLAQAVGALNGAGGALLRGGGG